MENLTENLTDEQQLLVDAIQDLGHALNDMSAALKVCREKGMDQNAIYNTISSQIPEEDQPAFKSQWPMLSMMLAAL